LFAQQVEREGLTSFGVMLQQEAKKMEISPLAASQTLIQGTTSARGTYNIDT
jgi:hypothetical protein